jgi:energy-coupling factor transporter ATP-binding protein EcfA2
VIDADGPGAVRVAGLTHRYPDGTPSLAGVDLSVPAGGRLGIVGPNGAGKTTLMLCLAGVLRGEGEVRVHDLDVTRAPLAAVAEVLGLVFPDPRDQLFCMSVEDDVAFGLRNLGLPEADVAARVEAALAMVGLASRAGRMPHHLSCGEQKRVVLASVLAMRPRVLALDEPSAFLDPAGRRQLIRLLDRLDGTLVIASHDLDLVLETCTRTVLLDAGHVVADGPTSALLADEALLSAHDLELPDRLAGGLALRRSGESR